MLCIYSIGGFFLFDGINLILQFCRHQGFVGDELGRSRLLFSFSLSDDIWLSGIIFSYDLLC